MTSAAAATGSSSLLHAPSIGIGASNEKLNPLMGHQASSHQYSNQAPFSDPLQYYETMLSKFQRDFSAMRTSFEQKLNNQQHSENNEANQIRGSPRTNQSGKIHLSPNIPKTNSRKRKQPPRIVHSATDECRLRRQSGVVTQPVAPRTHSLSRRNSFDDDDHDDDKYRAHPDDASYHSSSSSISTEKSVRFTDRVSSPRHQESRGNGAPLKSCLQKGRRFSDSQYGLQHASSGSLEYCPDSVESSSPVSSSSNLKKRIQSFLTAGKSKSGSVKSGGSPRRRSSAPFIAQLSKTKLQQKKYNAQFQDRKDQYLKARKYREKSLRTKSKKKAKKYLQKALDIYNSLEDIGGQSLTQKMMEKQCPSVQQ